MGAFGIAASLIAAIILGLVIWRILTQPKSTDVVTLVSGSASGKSCLTSTLDLPRSFNQPGGAVFTYSGWILINDFTYNYGKRRTIFTKGDCPGVYLDSTSNGMLVVLNTYGATETVLISNLPAKKWIHFAIAVNQYSVDIYINGVVAQHHTLGQLPKQNDDNVKIGTTADNWDGVIANLQYTPRTLSSGDIQAQVSDVPKDALNAPSGPQYFDMTWYTGRLNST
jgi:hypothetical protein